MPRRAYLVGALLGTVLACGSETKSPETRADDAGSRDAESNFAATTSAPYDHRPAAVACGPKPTDNPGQGCSSDDDCTEQPFGRCTPYGCFYDACWVDEDCDTGEICICPDHPQLGYNTARCVKAACARDADCSGGALCRPSGTACDGLFVQGYYCDAPDDECTTDTDCAADHYCWYDEGLNHRVCRVREGCTVP
jgi:hypothetical protein